MNTPLIKPSLIYLINLCDNFKTALFIVMLVVGFAAAVVFMNILTKKRNDDTLVSGLKYSLSH